MKDQIAVNVARGRGVFWKPRSWKGESKVKTGIKATSINFPPFDLLTTVMNHDQRDIISAQEDNMYVKMRVFVKGVWWCASKLDESGDEKV